MMTVHAPFGVLLGGVFLLAAGGKLFRFPRFRDALGSYRVARPRALVAFAVPAAELAVGAALIAGVDAAGWAALGLLAAFSAALAVELGAGSAPPGCACLPGAGPPSGWTLLRNALLGAVAVAAALGAEPRLGPGFWTGAFVALWIAVLALAALLLSLYRQVGVLHLRTGPGFAFEHEAEGPPLGEPAPLGIVGRLLVFTSRACPVCAQITPGLRALAHDHALAVDHVRVDEPDGDRAAEEFAVPGTPYAVFIDPAGIVRAKGTVNTLEQLEGVIVAGRVREREAAGARAA
jgi:hypothetical protein